MKLVIAEKPSVAMALASVLGARTRKDGYVEGNGYIVSWCVGHLVGLCDASEYDEKYKKWRYEDLPIVPECWRHKVLDGTKKQYGILKKLMRDSNVDEVICATDAGREGELIFRLVYEQAGCKKPMKRLWISSMEEQAIKDGFASLKDGSCYDSLYQSALCRAKADWLVGINASRLFSVLYNQNLKVGRVQTPTLAMIVDRNQKIKEFTKEKYYMAHIKFDDMDAVTEHFQKKDGRIQTILLDRNSNVCVAGNRAFANAKGKYLAVIGYDDIWKADKLEKQIAFLEEHPDVGTCFTWMEVIDDNQLPISAEYEQLYHMMNADNYTAENWLHRMILQKSNWACAPSACIRRSVLEATGYYRYGLVQLQDFDLWLRVLNHTSVYVLQEKLTWYRQFGRKGTNLSDLTGDKGKENRLQHECWWIISNAIEQMSDSKFLEVFSEELHWKEAMSHEAVLCEKAFLLWSLGGSLAGPYFIDMLENAECREILEQKYQFTLNDFYALNRQA